jgi:glycosyltransferase involved in cell wall biosynthesis
MKLLWFPRFQPDIEIFTPNWREMYKVLTSMGHTVYLALAGRPRPGTFDYPYIHVPIFRIKYLRILSFWVSGFINFVIRYFMFAPDVVLLDIFTVWFGIIPFLFPGTKRCTIILDNRSPFYNSTCGESTLRNRLFRAYTRIAYIFCVLIDGAITTITDHYRESLIRDYRVSPKRIGVWTSGVNKDRFDSRLYVKNGHCFPWKGKFVVIQHGEISYNRGIFESIEAVSLVKDSKIALLIVGSAINNAEIDAKLDELIQTLKLSDSVYRISAVPHEEVPRYINSADCAIMAYPRIQYWNNNNPLKLLEYLAMGKVVICTDMWTFRDVCGTRKCAHYIKDNDPKTIARAIVWCYQNRVMLKQWGGEGIDIVKERFTWQRQAQNLLDFIESVKPKKENISDY